MFSSGQKFEISEIPNLEELNIFRALPSEFVDLNSNIVKLNFFFENLPKLRSLKVYNCILSFEESNVPISLEELVLGNSRILKIENFPKTLKKIRFEDMSIQLFQKDIINNCKKTLEELEFRVIGKYGTFFEDYARHIFERGKVHLLKGCNSFDLEDFPNMKKIIIQEVKLSAKRFKIPSAINLKKMERLESIIVIADFNGAFSISQTPELKYMKVNSPDKYSISFVNPETDCQKLKKIEFLGDFSGLPMKIYNFMKNLEEVNVNLRDGEEVYSWNGFQKLKSLQMDIAKNCKTKEVSNNPQLEFLKLGLRNNTKIANNPKLKKFLCAVDIISLGTLYEIMNVLELERIVIANVQHTLNLYLNCELLRNLKKLVLYCMNKVELDGENESPLVCMDSTFCRYVSLKNFPNLIEVELSKHVDDVEVINCKMLEKLNIIPYNGETEEDRNITLKNLPMCKNLRIEPRQQKNYKPIRKDRILMENVGGFTDFKYS